jgi:hypothetical protein
VVYPSFVSYYIYNNEIQKQYPTFGIYLAKIWSVHNVRSFIKANISSTLGFHITNLWLFVTACFKWFEESGSGFFDFVFYQTIIYYFLMIYGLIYGFCGFLNAWDYQYPEYAESMEHWYCRWPIYILYFIMILNTISLILAIALVIKAKSKD